MAVAFCPADGNLIITGSAAKVTSILFQYSWYADRLGIKDNRSIRYPEARQEAHVRVAYERSSATDVVAS